MDVILLRNVPPRPDSYAQRGGSAGGRTRVGIVVGYARSTPRDGYFCDKPAEMIAGDPLTSAGFVANLTPEFASDEIGFSAQDRQAPSRWTRSPFPLSRSLGLVT